MRLILYIRVHVYILYSVQFYAVTNLVLAAAQKVLSSHRPLQDVSFSIAALYLGTQNPHGVYTLYSFPFPVL